MSLRPRKPSSRPRGQSLVEFTLVLPILLLLVLTVGDFGRLFAASIVIDSAARTAAETAAAEFLREDLREAAPVSPAAYARVHQYAWQSACDEASLLPNAAPGSGGSECTGLPTVICVHDEPSGDPGCGNAYNVGGGIPSGCGWLAPGERPANAQTGGAETSRYVEVRVCYRFETFLEVHIPFFHLTLSQLGGEFAIERVRTFTVADY